jgi:ATP-binding cassette subfamily B protein
MSGETPGARPSLPRPLDFRAVLGVPPLVGLLRMAHGYRALYLLALLLIGASAAARTGGFFLLRFLVDRVLSHPDLHRLMLPSALGFVGLAVLEGAGTYGGGRLTAYTAENVARRLRDFLYDHLQRLSFAWHDVTPTGEIIERCTSDVDAVRRFFGDEVRQVGRIVFLFVINLAGLFSLDARLALLSVLVIPPVLAVSVLFFRRISDAYETYQDREARLSTTLQENLRGIRVVKAFGRHDFEREKFERDNRGKYEQGKLLTLLHALFWPTTDVLCGAQLLFGFAMAALAAIRGEITLGTTLAYFGMLAQIVWPMRNLGRLIVDMSTGLVSFGRVCEIIRAEEEPLGEEEGSRAAVDPSSPRVALRGEVVFERVGFAYDGGPPALRDVSFAAPAGSVVALLGPPGSGKTTLASLLPRFYEHTEGRILLDSRELAGYPRAFLRRAIGIVEQQPFLFSRTVRENIAFGAGRPVEDDEVFAAAKRAAIHDAILSFPKGYDTLVGERGVTLSGGQKQRVAIARALLRDPRILILDDSTSSVDTETEAAIRSALEELMRGRTTFVIAHRIQSLMKADLILVLDGGRITQSGTHAELVRQPGFYREICRLQAELAGEEEAGHALA